jgi:hypothetical protein
VCRLVGVICTCECRETAEVESGVASAGSAHGSRNKEAQCWGFLRPYRLRGLIALVAH